MTLYGGRLADHMRQIRAMRQSLERMRELDAREDEALRMFGIEVEYVHDERLIRTGGIVSRVAQQSLVPLWMLK